ncbi:MAG: M28 family peptidase [Chloroflexi bacterium]|nr:M28 family peptidase [Chloroflexota bacterium]
MKEIANISEQQVKHTFAFCDEVVENFPGRVAGSEAVRKAGLRVKEEFEKYCDAGTVKVDQFDIHPWSFLKYIPGLVVLYFACVVLLFLAPALAWISFAGMALGLFVFYGQFVRYWHLLDPLFPKRQAYNVYGSIEPSGEVKQQIVVSGHHDAAYVFHLLDKVPKYYVFLINSGILFLVLGFLVSLVATVLLVFNILLPQWIAVVLMVCGLLVLPMAFFTTGQVVPGAGDNMIAVAAVAEIAGLFGDIKKTGSNALKHTRLIIASFDAEEAGLRGARAFIKKHREELLNTKTYVLNLDTLYKLKALSFLDKDLNSTVKLSHQLAQACVDIAKDLGYPSTISAMTFGGGSTDAAAFGEAGIEATNLCAMSFDIKDYDQGWVYHTRNDVSKHIEPEAVEAALKVIRGYILKKDAV